MNRVVQKSEMDNTISITMRQIIGICNRVISTAILTFSAVGLTSSPLPALFFVFDVIAADEDDGSVIVLLQMPVAFGKLE